MKFRIITDAEIERLKKEEEIERLKKQVKEGLCQFLVIDSQDHISKENKESIKLKLKATDDEGHESIIFEYLPGGDTIFSHHRRKSFCEQVGLMDKFNEGELSAIDCLDRYGECLVKVEKGKNGYPDSLKVHSYPHLIEKPSSLEDEPIFDDKMPF